MTEPPKKTFLQVVHERGLGTPMRSPFSVAEEQHALRLAEEQNARVQRAKEELYAEVAALSPDAVQTALSVRALAEEHDAEGGALPGWAWRLRDASIKAAEDGQTEMVVDVQSVMRLLAWAQERSKLLKLIREAVRTADAVAPRQE